MFNPSERMAPTISEYFLVVEAAHLFTNGTFVPKTEAILSTLSIYVMRHEF